MDSLLVYEDDDLFYGDRSLPIQRLPDFEPEQLFLVDHRWWEDARKSLVMEIGGSLYSATSSVSCSGTSEDETASEVVLDMRREERPCQEEGVSGREYALVLEWMFLRALKWHYDIKKMESFLTSEANWHDLFSLQVRLLLSNRNKALAVRICKKDNEVGAFSKACNIFHSDVGSLHIWDFSGQITQLSIGEGSLTDELNKPQEEIFLELQVYGLSFYAEQRERKDVMAAEDSKFEGFSSSDFLIVNGTTDNLDSDFRVTHVQFSSGCNGSFMLGLTGLCNLGNTCFMNSAIQCLVHTPEVVDYFLGDFRKDLNFENPLGMNGKLALAFGDLLRKLWAPGAKPIAPRSFKSTLSGFAPQFSGYNQHDSQEFLAFLLDGIHEDLNRVKHKPYIEVKDTDGRSDEDVADEHWRNHLARNDSIIVDTCQGQYRSTLVCPICNKFSVTFDPFMYLSLPLPSTTMRTMTLTVLSTDGTALPFPVTVTVPKYGRFKDLVLALNKSCSLGENETLTVAEIYNNRVLHFLDKPSDSIELVRDNDQLVAYRRPKESSESPLVVFTHQRKEKSPLSESHFARSFGIPFVATIPEFSKGSDVREKFLELLNPFLLPNDSSLGDFDDAEDLDKQDTEMDDTTGSSTFKGDSNNEIDDFLFCWKEKGPLYPGTKISLDEKLPILGSRKIDMLVTWSDKMLSMYDTSRLSLLPEICRPTLLPLTPPESVSLYKCLEAFLTEEPLGPEDMWYCPNCKKHRQASKKLDLWRLPEVLIIHLKRFSYNRFLKDKLETYVDFPILDFDLSNHIVKNGNRESHHYILYAVSNHYGAMGGGHYTAFVKHGRDQWYEFDDSRVFPVSEDQVKTAAAYVLFYRRISDVR